MYDIAMKTAEPITLDKILAQLIHFRTEEEAYDEKTSLAQEIKNNLRGNGMWVTGDLKGSSPFIFASPKNKKDPKVLLQAHLDVVPAHPDQYSLKQESGKLCGRGVYDMKFAAACYLKLVEDLQDELSKYDFGVMFSFDEEVGGDGVKNFLGEGYNTEICILPDGGDNWAIETVSNGLWITKLVSRGKKAHGSRPWEGNCAINCLIDALQEIKALYPVMNSNKHSLTISQIDGGSAVNQVADYAEATLDMRFVNAVGYIKRRKNIEAIASKYMLEIHDLAQIDYFETDLTHPHIANFIQIAERMRGKTIKSQRSLGASDAHYFAEHGIPVILIRPDGGGPHSDNEWIDKAGLEEFYEVLKAYVMETAKIA